LEQFALLVVTKKIGSIANQPIALKEGERFKIAVNIERLETKSLRRWQNWRQRKREGRRLSYLTGTVFQCALSVAPDDRCEAKNHYERNENNCVKNAPPSEQQEFRTPPDSI
jgi:hypothetical protein